MEYKYAFSTKADKIFNALFFILLSIVFLYLLSPFELKQLNPILQDVEKVLIGAQSVLILMVLLLFRFLLGKTVICFTIVDVVLSGYVLYLLLHMTILRPISPDPLFIVKNSLLCAIYIGFRKVQQKWSRPIFWIVLLATLCQIYYGVAKQTKWLAPGFGLSDIRGSYINQGPFAGAIACSLVLVIGFFLDHIKRKHKRNPIHNWAIVLVCLALLAILSVVLISTASRAAWIACMTGSLFCIWKIYGMNLRAKCLFRSPKSKPMTIVVLLAFMIGASYVLYHYKKDSADGRLLIWKVTMEMISDRPILGHGINAFPSDYMQYQADYFEKDPNSPYRYLASDNRYTFNEFFGVVSEQGLVGILALSILAYFSIRSIKKRKYGAHRNSLDSISQSGLILIVVFGLFSYPLEILQLKIIAILFLAVLSSLSKKVLGFRSMNLGYVHKYIQSFGFFKNMIVFVILLAGLSISWVSIQKLSKTYIDWNSALLELRAGNYDKYILFCEKTYPELRNNGDFLTLYGKSLTKEKEYVKAIPILKQASSLIPSTTIYVDMGISHEGLGNYKRAEACWARAGHMVPSQFNPGYLTAKMYQDLGQRDKAKNIASDLLNNKEIKIHSIEVYHILNELKNILEEP